jgi:uncharacterized protein (DUF1330 family)
MLSDAELEEIVGYYERGSLPDAVARWRGLFDATARGPIALVNRFKLRDRALYDDGREATGLDALLAYSATSVPALDRVGGRFLLSSAVLAPLFGTADDTDLVVVGWYPERRALLDLLRDPAYRAAFVHRRAAVASEWVVAVDAPAA